AGYDPKDSTSLDVDKKDYTEKLNDGVKGMVFGIPEEYMGEGLSEPIRERVEDTLKELQKRGAKVKTLSLPHTKYAVAAYYIVAPAEASANLARYDGIKYGYRASGADNLIDEYIKSRQEGFGPEVKRRIMIGTYALSAGYYDAYYLKAQKVRTLIREDYRAAFKDVDLLLGPTSPTTAFNLGEKFNDPLQMYLSDIYTISCNLAGIPGISVPAGADSEGLPIGLQVMGDYLTEANILRAAREIEKIYE
ncbi:MAG: amidase family protein, partial [Elusimicrobiota bacterium]|nr:amidase family protein [Elusimicrobiota bacterium]